MNVEKKKRLRVSHSDREEAIVYRHSAPVRVFHWVNVLSFVLLLMSGLQIFNSYPRLHWGNDGNANMPAIFEITGVPDLNAEQSWVQIGSYKIDTSGFMGVAQHTQLYGIKNIAFPSWMTLPSGVLDLANGRGWHILMMWVFVLNLSWYIFYNLLSGRFWRTLLPSPDQVKIDAILRDLWMHVRLKHSVAEESLRYNLLQKLTYIIVLFGILPLIVLSGMTMSPSAVAAYPWLLEMFDGRHSGRTIHFVLAFCLSMFVFIHIFQVVVSGFANAMRSIITGYFRIPPGERK